MGWAIEARATQGEKIRVRARENEKREKGKMQSEPQTERWKKTFQG